MERLDRLNFGACMEPHMILVGDLTTGYHAVGTFDSYVQAYDYAEKWIACPTKWAIFALFKPEDE